MYRLRTDGNRIRFYVNCYRLFLLRLFLRLERDFNFVIIDFVSIFGALRIKVLLKFSKPSIYTAIIVYISTNIMGTIYFSVMCYYFSPRPIIFSYSIEFLYFHYHVPKNPQLVFRVYNILKFLLYLFNFYTFSKCLDLSSWHANKNIRKYSLLIIKIWLSLSKIIV